MKVLPALTIAAAVAHPVFSQSDPPGFASDCLPVNAPIYMCDDQHAWVPLDLPEDLQGLGLEFGDGITAEVSVMVSPDVGIQVRAQRYGAREPRPALAEDLTRIDGFPAITYISRTERDGKAAIRAETVLLLHNLSLSAETFQTADSYTPEHAARHAEMLAGITHEWSFD